MSVYPENVAAAFPGGPAAGKLPPLNLLMVLALRAMRSPLMQSNADGSPAECSLDDALLAIGIMRAPADTLVPLVERASRDTTCEQLGIALSESDRADMLAARRELRAMALRGAADCDVAEINQMVRGLQAQMDHAFTTLVPMADPENQAPLAPGREAGP